MYGDARTAMRRRYAENEGWNIFEQDQRKDGYRPDLVVEKPRKPGFFYDTPKKKAIAEVKSEKVITEDHIKQLTGYAQKHAGGQAQIVGKHLIVPAGANVDGVRTLINRFDIDVIYLKNFRV